MLNTNTIDMTPILEATNKYLGFTYGIYVNPVGQRFFMVLVPEEFATVQDITNKYQQIGNNFLLAAYIGSTKQPIVCAIYTSIGKYSLPDVTKLADIYKLNTADLQDEYKKIAELRESIEKEWGIKDAQVFTYEKACEEAERVLNAYYADMAHASYALNIFDLAGDEDAV